MQIALKCASNGSMVVNGIIDAYDSLVLKRQLNQCRPGSLMYLTPL